MHGVIDFKTSLTKFIAPPEDLATTLIDEVLVRQVPSQDNATVLVLSVKGVSPVNILKRVPIAAGARRVSLPQLNGRLLFGAAVVLLMIIIWWAVKSQNERFGIKAHSSQVSSANSTSSAAHSNQQTESPPSAGISVTTAIPENNSALSPKAGDNSVLIPSAELISSASSVSLDSAPHDPVSAAQAAGALSSSTLAFVSSGAPSVADATTSVAEIGESSSSPDVYSASSATSEEQGDLAVVASDASSSSFAANWSNMSSTDTVLVSSSEVSPAMFSSAPTTFAKDASVVRKRTGTAQGGSARANSNPAVPNDNNPDPTINIHLNFKELLRNLPRLPIPSAHPREPLRR